MPLRSRLLEWSTITGLVLVAGAVAYWFAFHSVSLAVVQSAVAAGLIVVRDSKLLALFTPTQSPVPSAALTPPNSESPDMPKIYQTLAEIQADLPDLVTVLQDFVAVSKLIEAKDFVGIIGSYAKWEADVVKLVNDVRGSAVSQETQPSLPLAAAPNLPQSAPSGSQFIQTVDAPAPGLQSLAAQAGLPESAK